ncbi:MAG: glycosyltransferase family 4 protein [Anaerolineae bacterium]|nr:glycosyltransferase family 4 protein [Anaerolineae bacterium]
MNILHLVHQYPPEFVGGTELYAQTLAREQVARGHRVTVIFPSLAKPAAAQHFMVDEGVAIRPIPVGPRSRTTVFLNTFRNKQIETAVGEALDSTRPDIVHIQHLMGIPVSVVTQIRERSIPTVITLHDYWYGCANAQLLTNTDQTICSGPDHRAHNCGRCTLARAGLPPSGIAAWSVAPMMRRRNALLRDVLTHADKVIAPTEFVRTIYAQIGLPTANIVLIPHGIDLPQAAVAAAHAQHASRPPRDQLHVGYVGSIARQKGLHVLIEAVNALSADKIKLTIYGSLDTFPDYSAQLQQSIRHDNIQLAGRINRADLWPALADLDVFVLPTLWYEVSPLTIQEVFAVGLPIIASHIGAMPEKIHDEIDGLLFPPGDASALSAILERLWQDRGLVSRLERGIKPVRTIEDQLNDIETVYATVL